MKFLHKDFLISIFQTGMTSDDNIIFKYTIFSANGQMVDADEIIASSMKHAKERIKEYIK